MTGPLDTRLVLTPASDGLHAPGLSNQPKFDGSKCSGELVTTNRPVSSKTGHLLDVFTLHLLPHSLLINLLLTPKFEGLFNTLSLCLLISIIIIVKWCTCFPKIDVREYRERERKGGGVREEKFQHDKR